MSQNFKKPWNPRDAKMKSIAQRIENSQVLSDLVAIVPLGQREDFLRRIRPHVKSDLRGLVDTYAENVYAKVEEPAVSSAI